MLYVRKECLKPVPGVYFTLDVPHLLSGALTYAELGTMMPESGGEYLYIRRGFGGLVGYLYAFMNVTIIKPRKGAGS